MKALEAKILKIGKNLTKWPFEGEGSRDKERHRLRGKNNESGEKEEDSTF